jgi:ferredoxin-nitrate reductase
VHDPIAEPWGPATPIRRGKEWPERVDVRLAEGVTEDRVERWVHRLAPALDGDAMDIAVAGGRIAGVRGRGVDRVNRGRLGPEDLFGWQANASTDRLTRPLVGGAPASWDDAIGTVADRCRAVLEGTGPAAIAFSTSGQLFAEEYWTLAGRTAADDGLRDLGREAGVRRQL